GGVGGVRSHTRFELPIDADRHTRRVSYLSKRAIAIVMEQIIRHVVVGDKNVLPPVVVIVKGDHTQPVPRLDSQPGALAHVAKSAIAVVVIQDAPFVTENE